MKKFKLLNNTFGWLAFAIAAVTYCLTVEPTASFWDCPEFILSGYKLEIGHPPGAPFFMLTANFFSLIAEPENVAYMVNIMSAVLSAAGIMFLFWSITHLARKLIVGNSKEISMPQTVTILAAGMVGALAYTWSDTYWFSAVEGEVYGYSSLFTAVVFWLILKWEDCADSPHSDRWLVLIAYLVGLSIGVHLLNLLCIPAIVLVAYYRKFPNANWKGMLLAMAASGAIVFVVLYGIVPGVVKVGGWSELLFVNVLGMPFNTGLFVYIALLAGTLIAGLFVTEKGGSRTAVAALFTLGTALLGIPFYGYGTMSVVIGLLVLAGIFLCVKLVKIGKELISYRVINTIFLCMFTIMIGYASYALIVIRSAANTPMDQNSPEDIFTLGSYLNREQYGSRPLFYGPGFESEVKIGENSKAVTKETSPIYARTSDGKYKLIGHNKEYEFEQNMLFPRMFSTQHAAAYEEWIGRKVTNRVDAKYPDYQMYKRDPRFVRMPTQRDNLAYMARYQINHMYWRYFMWNFVGRQNDIQGNGEPEYGNWITGIPVMDRIIEGDIDKMPKELKENKGRNVYFALPLILGLLGIVWQLMKGKEGKKQLWVVFMLFFMTGIAIVLYLNQTPGQPRERDYAFAGSFYAFAIWIGLGVAGLAQLIQEVTKKENIIISSAVAFLCLLVPVQMLSQTWDDHNRSGRYACRDFGLNYLNTLPQEGCPIIYTCGDNDTFPLWYNQEVEENRTDARVCNLSYLSADWYIDQMRSPAYDSPALPITWQRKDYEESKNADISFIPIDFAEEIDKYLEQHPELKNELFDMNYVTKHWILDAGANTKERKAVEEMISYAKRNIVESLNERLEKIELEIKKHNRFGSSSDNMQELMYYTQDLKNYIAQTAKYDVTQPMMPHFVTIPVDAEAIKRSGMRIPEAIKSGKETMPERMEIDFKLEGRRNMGLSLSLARHELLILDMLANAKWERPIYMAITVGGSNYPIELQDFFQCEGLAYRITPFKWGVDDGIYDVDKLYDNMMNRYKWGGFKEYGNYYADETIRHSVSTLRNQLYMLAALMQDEARKLKKENAEMNGMNQLLEEELAMAKNSTKKAAEIDTLFCKENLSSNKDKIEKNLVQLRELASKTLNVLEKWYTEFPNDIIPFDASDSRNTANDNSILVASIYMQMLEWEQNTPQEQKILDGKTLELLQKRAAEILGIAFEREYSFVRWYNSFGSKKLSSRSIAHVSNLCDAIELLGYFQHDPKKIDSAVKQMTRLSTSYMSKNRQFNDREDIIDHVKIFKKVADLTAEGSSEMKQMDAIFEKLKKHLERIEKKNQKNAGI